MRCRLPAKAAVAASILVVSFAGLCSQSAQSSQLPSKAAESHADATQQELTHRILVSEKIRDSGNPDGIAQANRKLIAAALREMGRLRLLESAPGQSAALYRASLQFESFPAVYAELARSSLMAGHIDDAVLEAQQAIKADPQNPDAYLALGSAYSHKQEYTKAADALSHAARLQPKIENLYSLAICWLSTNTAEGRQRANAVFAQMKEMAGDSGSLHVLMGRAYRDANMMPEAVREFKRAIELDTSTPHAHYFLGLAYLSLNEWNWTPEVQAELEKEVQYHPQDYLGNYMLGLLASSRREYSVADKYLKTAAALNSEWPDPFLYMGLDAFAQGDQRSAEVFLRKAIELTGTDEARTNYQIRRAYVDLGRILAREGREQESEVYVAKARDLENKVMADSQQRTTSLLISEGGNTSDLAAVMPLSKQQENQAAPISESGAYTTARLDISTSAGSNLNAAERATAKKEEDMLRPILGQSYSDLATAEAIRHDYSAALTHYETAEQWDRDIPDLEKNLGQAAFRAGDYSEAIHALSETVKQNPNAMNLRAMLGMAYFQTQRYGDAATTFYPLGDAGIHDSEVGYAWAYSLTKAGDLKDASQVLAIYQSGTLSNEALLLVGQLWADIGDYDRSVQTFHHIQASDPSFPKLYYDVALTDIRAGKWSDARGELDRQLASTPGDADTMFNLGFVDIEESKKDDAMKLFEQVIAKDPDHSDAQYQIGKLLMEQGRVQEALPHLEIAARLSPDKDYVHYQLQAAYRRLSRTSDADRELALYKQLKAKSRAAATTEIDQQLQQKQ
ncbi:MAG TPA: tetratricopeptide repeat protein [Silvibacterium sp.]|nr:tetratricopeptide repeat protein [Silvibacterium sp.]